jgi:hypothetical protein
MTPLVHLDLQIFLKFEMTLMLFSGAGGKMIHEKNLKQKISRHCPFKVTGSLVEYLLLEAYKIAPPFLNF